MPNTPPGSPLRARNFTHEEVLHIKAAQVAMLYDKGWLTEHSPGVTYICLVPSGYIKIGYSESLAHRLISVSKDHGGRVTVLAILPGGFTREQCLHSRFSNLRLPVTGELFEPTPELLSFAASVPPCPEMSEELAKYEAWKFTARKS